MVFDNARRHHHFLDGVTPIDDSLLKTVRSVTVGLEVHARTPAEWEHAILSGFAIFAVTSRYRPRSWPTWWQQGRRPSPP